jgi:hypothetical protein
MVYLNSCCAELLIHYTIEEFTTNSIHQSSYSHDCAFRFFAVCFCSL